MAGYRTRVAMAFRAGIDGAVTGTTYQLELTAVSKRFGDVHALDGATFKLRRGTVHALLGENGAGKTTLMRIAFGMVKPDAGTLHIDGRAQRLSSPADAIQRRIAMVHQHFSLVPNMTAIENFSLGGTGLYDERAATRRLAHYAGLVALAIEPGRLAHEMSTAEQQQLEIAKALGRDCSTLILDEPTAVLPPAQSSALLELLRALAAQGRSVVLITHKVRDALEVADEITVLRYGRTVISGSAQNLDQSALLTAMLGDSASSGLEESEPHASHDVTVASLRAVRALDPRSRERLIDVTLDVHPGETVGIAGLEGSGHRLLLRVLAGRHRPAEGSVSLPADIGFIPEDRAREALVLSFGLRENIALRRAGARRGWIRWRHWSDVTRALLHDFDVRAVSERSAAYTLSGGNQQKLVAARELSQNPPLVVAENPVRGLDARASLEIRDRLRRARQAGAAVVFYSSDLDELVVDADRVLVVYSGHVRHCPASRSAIGRALIGAS